LQKNREQLSTRRRHTIQLATVSSLAGLLGRALSIPASIAVAFLLGPFQLGVLALMRLIQMYVGFSHLGLQAVLPRNVPLAYGAGDRRAGRYTTDVVFTGVLISLTAALAILWLLYFTGVTYKGALTLPRLVLLTAMIVTARALAFLRDYSKAEGELMSMAKTDVLLSSVLPVLTMAGTALFRVEGALLAAVLANCATIVYSLKLLSWPRFSCRVDGRKTIDLLKTGWLIAINKITDSTFWSADILVIGLMMTPREVGIYSLALAAITAVHPFLGGFNSAVYRRMLEEAGEKGTADVTYFRKYAGSSSFVAYLLLNSLVLGVAALGFRAIVRYGLPEYADASRAITVLTLGYTVFGSMIFMRYYLDATGQLQKRFGLVVGALAVNIALDYAAISLGYGLQGVAWACTVAFLLNAAAILIFCFRQIYGDWRYGIRFVRQLLIIALLCYGFLALSSRWDVWAPGDGGAAFRWLHVGADFLVKAFAFVAWCVGCYLVVFRNSRLDQEIVPGLRYFWTLIRGRARVDEAAA
jgi:O-antigen/teichoic acid export membrane protein